MTLKGLLHCSAIIIEIVKVGDIRSVTMNIFQVGFGVLQGVQFHL